MRKILPTICLALTSLVLASSMAIGEAHDKAVCEKRGSEARLRVEKVPMDRRAPLVWKELAEEAIHCGHADPELLDMARTAAALTGVEREWQLGEALRRYKQLKAACPKGASLLKKLRTQPLDHQVDFLISRCPIKKPLGNGAGRDLGAMTFLYAQTLQHHWQQKGVEGNPHTTLLSTLLLSTALERAAIDNLIDHLVDPKPHAKYREDIERSIKEHGLDAIPVLVDHIADQRTAGDVPAPAPGHCMNLPIFEMGNPPDECQNLEATSRPVTVGERCQRLLYDIVTPVSTPTLEQGRVMWKAQVDREFVIKDWNRWWGKHQGKSLAELHAQARKLIDTFWRRGWDKGPVEWK